MLLSILIYNPHVLKQPGEYDTDILGFLLSTGYSNEDTWKVQITHLYNCKQKQNGTFKQVIKVN